MNKEDIIRMARDAGAELAELPMGDAWLFTDDECLERFAALVASAEHKRVQQVYTDAATDSVKAAIAYEREACAKVCDDIHAKYKWPQDTAEKVASQWCADAIRAKGESSIRVQA